MCVCVCGQAHKELLDAELDFHKKMSSGEDTTDLRRKLGLLQVEVRQTPACTTLDHKTLYISMISIFSLVSLVGKETPLECYSTARCVESDVHGRAMSQRLGLQMALVSLVYYRLSEANSMTVTPNRGLCLKAAPHRSTGLIWGCSPPGPGC